MILVLNADYSHSGEKDGILIVFVLVPRWVLSTVPME